MGGRDPSEDHRAATPLELLFDLTFVIAFGAAANELAHLLAEGHIGTALLGFSFATFGIAWAWINFSWFASAYDTDDWVFRLATMVQMLGVLIFALGLPDMFASLYDGDTVDNRVMVAGYIVMRLALVFQWLRAARQDPPRRAACHKYVTTLLVAQAGWVALLIAETSVGVTFVWVAVLLLVELAGPVLAETRHGGTPWHPHHIAERYGLLVIIALGEGLLGTAFALSVADRPRGARLVARRRRPRPRRDGAHVRDVVDLLHPAVRRDPGAAPGAILRLGIRAHRPVRRPGRRGRRAARRRLLPRAPQRPRHHRHGAHGRRPGGAVRRPRSTPSTTSCPASSTRSTCCCWPAPRSSPSHRSPWRPPGRRWSGAWLSWP